MKMTQEQWNSLRYSAIVQQAPEDEGGDFFAWIPALGRGLFMSDGATANEALTNLEELRRSNFELVIQSGRPVPLPEDEEETVSRPSGKWAMRATPELHETLQKAAKRANVSFNTYCIKCLSRGYDAHAAEIAVKEAFIEMKSELKQQLSEGLRREVRGEMRLAAQYITDELEFERHHTTFLQADYEVEESTVVVNRKPSIKENIQREIGHRIEDLDLAA